VRSHRRSLITLAMLAVAALALTSVALAGSGRDNHHKRNHKIAQLVKKDVKKDIKNAAAKKRPTFAPTKIVGAAESSAVLLDHLTQQFMQVTFDRGRVTAVSASSITLQQQQGGVVWRTQTFTVPATTSTNTATASTGAVVTLNGHRVQLTQIPTGSSARIESTGTPGGALTVVRVNAYSHGEAPLPPAS
jgi:hypothetical protein